jgi:hypothetical protein
MKLPTPPFWEKHRRIDVLGGITVEITAIEEHVKNVTGK